jgi:hypothetical protein
VLYVEDNAFNRTTAYSMFTRYEMKIQCRTDGLQGMRAFQVSIHPFILLFPLGIIQFHSNSDY